MLSYIAPQRKQVYHHVAQAISFNLIFILFPYIPFRYIPWKWKMSHSIYNIRQLANGITSIIEA
jgi:hypothetical protein